jgi:hypothetical protein
LKQLNKIKEVISGALENSSLIKLRMTGLRFTAEEKLKEIIVRPIEIKNSIHLQFTIRYQTNDITKNYKKEEALEFLDERMQNDFYFLSVVTLDKVYQLDLKKNRITSSKNQNNKPPSLSHNKEKVTLLSAKSTFFYKLGITSKAGHLLKGKEAKFRQINKFVEILKPHLPIAINNKTYKVVDMGCGKGYLTFALYDYLTNTLEHQVEMKGVDQREELMNSCNLISKESNYKGLSFEQGKIDAHSGELDILIALHACDTATDDVLIKGILSEAQLIVCSPCCHKQVRKSMKMPTSLSGISNYGILVERQAEIVTDSIRTLILNHYGYKTKIVEFISGEHTPKNLLIIAEKKYPISVDNKYLKSIRELKSTFGVKEHYIEGILNNE